VTITWKLEHNLFWRCRPSNTPNIKFYAQDFEMLSSGQDR